jgi:hypothetical protein
MAQNVKVTEETFGTDPSNPKVRKGTVEIFGHTVKDGAAIPDKGFSVNVKTGEPAKSAK